MCVFDSEECVWWKIFVKMCPGCQLDVVSVDSCHSDPCIGTSTLVFRLILEKILRSWSEIVLHLVNYVDIHLHVYFC